MGRIHEEQLPLLTSASPIVPYKTTKTVRRKPKKKQAGTATTFQTSVNISKACMGTGMLALPYAASQGGLVFSVIGMGFITMWNLYAVDRLVKCRAIVKEKEERLTGVGYLDILENMEYSEKGRCANLAHRQEVVRSLDGLTTLGKVAWYCFGSFGLHVLDFIMVLFFLGIIIAYEDAIASFLLKTPFTTSSPLMDASIISLLVIAPLSCAPDVGFLSKFSAVGLIAIIITFSMIFLDIISRNTDGNAITMGFAEITSKDFWPDDMTAVGNWFGCIVFGFGGAVPITYNFQESMREPDKMTISAFYALILVFLTNVLISDGVVILSFSGDGTHATYEGDVLQHLPTGMIIPTAIRLMMTIMVSMTAPLLVIPCAELIEKKASNGGEVKFGYKILTRFGICLFCTFVSSVVPEFVSVIAFVGSFSVSLVSFVFPSLFYVVLVLRERGSGGADGDSSTCATILQSFSSLSSVVEDNDNLDDGCEGDDNGIGSVTAAAPKKEASSFAFIIADIAMLIWGIVATTIATVLSFNDMVASKI